MKTIGPFDAIHFREIFASDCGDFSVKTQLLMTWTIIFNFREKMK